MALSMPLGREFFGGLKVAAARFLLPATNETSRTAGGEVLRASLGARLWQGDAELAIGYHDDQMAIEATLARLQDADGAFFVYDPRRLGPRADPDGIILGANTPVIHTLDANNREMRVAGLPVGYILSAGDMLSFTYGSSPTRYALHRLVTGAVADVSGVSPLFEVVPRIRPGALVGAAVTLVRPFCKAILTDPDYGAGQPVFTAGARFSFQQTLR